MPIDALTFGEFFQRFGWMVMVLYFLLERVWPFFVGTFFPQRAVERNAEMQRLHSLEEKQVQAQENVAVAVREMAVAIVQMNERMNHHLALQAEHARITADAITTMRERTSAYEKSKRGARQQHPLDK